MVSDINHRWQQLALEAAGLHAHAHFAHCMPNSAVSRAFAKRLISGFRNIAIDALGDQPEYSRSGLLMPDSEATIRANIRNVVQPGLENMVGVGLREMPDISARSDTAYIILARGMADHSHGLQEALLSSPVDTNHVASTSKHGQTLGELAETAKERLRRRPASLG